MAYCGLWRPELVSPETHAIICTAKEGGVVVVTPLIDLGWMSHGGYWENPTRGFLDELVRRKACPKLQKGRNITEDAAWRFVKAMQFGGLTTAEAWDVIRVHDAERYGYDAQMIRRDELPDRWFRGAWTRERSNSGLPYVELEKARGIQWKRLVGAVSREDKRRGNDLWGLPPVRFQKDQYRDAITRAQNAEELRRIWIEGVPA